MAQHNVPRSRIATRFEDTERATDLVLLPDNVMMRTRKNYYRLHADYRWHVTFRSTNPAGRSEWHKVFKLNQADRMFYAFADSRGRHLDDWWFLVDLHRLRESEPMVRSGTKANEDGSAFIWYDVRTMPPSAVIASAQPIPFTPRAYAHDRPKQLGLWDGVA